MLLAPIHATGATEAAGMQVAVLRLQDKISKIVPACSNSLKAEADGRKPPYCVKPSRSHNLNRHTKSIHFTGNENEFKKIFTF